MSIILFPYVYHLICPKNNKIIHSITSDDNIYLSNMDFRQFCDEWNDMIADPSEKWTREEYGILYIHFSNLLHIEKNEISHIPLSSSIY